MPPAHADRNLLFGILALQMDFISRDALVAAMNAWVLDKAKPLGQVLQQQNALSEEEHALLEAMVRKHLEKHNNDPQQSLAALSSVSSARRQLEQVADPDVQASLAHVSLARAEERDDFATRQPSVPLPALEGSRFRVLRPHARGGLGEVFVAHDRELHREVALKEIQERHADNPDSRARFLLEGEITGRLEHPNIVPVYSLGTYADGRPFYAMRFVQGDDLQDAIQRYHRQEGSGDPRQRNLALRQLLGRFVDVCNAIAYAHSRGVLHRDLKPGNILLGKYGETLVVDWGLAKALGRSEGSESLEAPVEPVSGSGSAPTQMGTAIGTPAYMSPEQAAGRLDELGPPSDVYSLGATLYCMLTGHAPFAERDMGAVLQKVQKGDFPPPRQVKREIPVALEAVCLKAMALRPPDRYASAKELAEEIERWLADEPVSAYREPLRLRLARWRRRHPALVTGTAALVFTALLGLGIGALLLSQEKDRTLTAEQDKVKAQQAKLDEQQKRALAQVDALLNATPKAVPTILDGLEPYRAEVRPRFREVRQQAEPKDATEAARKLWQQHRTRAALALLPEDPEQLALLKERLLAEDTEPEETLLLRDQATLHGGKELAKELWTVGERRGVSPPVRFRALVALARLDPQNPRWKEVGRDVVGPLLAAEPLHAAVWSAGLRDVKEHLLAALEEAFRDGEHAAERRLATSVLVDYVANDADRLADLLMDADAQQFAVLLPKLRAHGERGLAPLLAELDRQPARSWKDPPLDPSWKHPAAELVRKMEQAQGLLGARFALCQALPLEEFVKVAEALRPCGYRPIRCRPYAAGPGMQVAAVWARDGRAWDLAHDLTADAVRQRDAEQQKRQQRPVDVAGYLAKGRERYAVVWVKTDPKEDVRLYVGVSERNHRAAWQPLRKDELQPSTLHTFTLANGDDRFSSVWRKPAPAGQSAWNSNEQAHADQPALTDLLALDVSMTMSRAAFREIAGEAVAWVGGTRWPALTWRSQQPVLAHPTLRYAGTWQASATLEATELQGLAPVAHLARCRELITAGYRPAALSLLPSPPLRGRGVGGEGVLAVSVWHRPVIAEDEKERLAKRQANAGVALLRLDRPERVWPLLKHRPDPRVRSYLIHRLSPLGADPQALWRRFEVEENVTIRRALLLCLGEFGEGELPVAVRNKLLPRLFELYRNDPDAGLHGAAAWLLRQWGQRDKLKELDERLASRKRDGEKASPVALAPGGKHWYVNGQGQTLVLIGGPGAFWMGSPRTEAERQGGPDDRAEQRHYRRIGRSFALAAHEVTVEQFQRFRKDHAYNKAYARSADCPMNVVTWYDAAAYCNWLSKEEGIPEDQWCYLPNEEGNYTKGMTVRPNYLSLRGYRLPTEAEWEYACRAGAVTARYYGETDELLANYAWYTKNSKDRWMRSVGSFKPNDLGLFDMLGNAIEWCQEPIFYYTPGTLRSPRADIGYNGDIKDISDNLSRLLRGGSFSNLARNVRSAQRNDARPDDRSSVIGFRPARTVVNDGPPPRPRQAP